MTQNEKAEEVRIPFLFNHYEVERVLGSGAMGVVYLARDLRIGRFVALKTVAPHFMDRDQGATEAFRLRFKREAELGGSFVHPNIVTLYEVGYEGQRFTFLAMEWVDGESLLSLMRRTGKLSVENSCRIVDDVLRGLAHAHDRGVIHRDVKPANVLISIHGQAKLSDFGIARAIDGNHSITDQGQLLGTPHYMAPEQIAGRAIDARIDLFSVGVMLYEMLTSRKPFDGAGMTDVLYRIVHEPAATLDDTVPTWCAEFLARLMAKDPDDRFASAGEASRELHRLMSLRQMQREDELPRVDLVIQRHLTAEETPTTPITASSLGGMRAGRIMRHVVPRGIALPVVAGLLVVFGGYIVALSRGINEDPPTTFSQGQLEEFREKRASLDAAVLLYEAGAIDESKRRFEQHLLRYPESSVAREWLTRVEARLAEKPVAVSEEKSARRMDRDAVKPTPKKDTDKKMNLWNRFRSLFKRNNDRSAR